jgi:hypothetical protein
MDSMAMRRLRHGYSFIGADGKAQLGVTEVNDCDPAFKGQEHKFHPPVAPATLESVEADPVLASPSNRQIETAPKKRAIK